MSNGRTSCSSCWVNIIRSQFIVMCSPPTQSLWITAQEWPAQHPGIYHYPNARRGVFVDQSSSNGRKRLPFAYIFCKATQRNTTVKAGLVLTCEYTSSHRRVPWHETNPYACTYPSKDPDPAFFDKGWKSKWSKKNNRIVFELRMIAKDTRTRTLVCVCHKFSSCEESRNKL
jgi:hypothetical protein